MVSFEFDITDSWLIATASKTYRSPARFSALRQSTLRNHWVKTGSNATKDSRVNPSIAVLFVTRGKWLLSRSLRLWLSMAGGPSGWTLHEDNGFAMIDLSYQIYNHGERSALFIIDSASISSFSASPTGLSTAQIRLFALIACFINQRSLLPGTSFSNNPHSP
jgi:hypothetical protein